MYSQMLLLQPENNSTKEKIFQPLLMTIEHAREKSLSALKS